MTEKLDSPTLQKQEIQKHMIIIDWWILSCRLRCWLLKKTTMQADLTLSFLKSFPPNNKKIIFMYFVKLS